MIGADFELINVQRSTKRIFTMSGVARVVKIKDKIEEEINKEIIENISKEDKNEGVI